MAGSGGEKRGRGAEADSGVATDILKGFVDRKRAQGAARESRSQHYTEAVRKADTFWEKYDMDDIGKRIGDYQERTGSGFRTPSGRFSTMRGTHQYPFVEVAPGVHMTIREVTEGEVMRGPRDGGEVTAYKLVVQDEGLPGPQGRHEETGDIAGEAVFATIPVHGMWIQYPDSAINADPVLAEEADREVLAQLQAVQEGLLDLLGNPEPLPAAAP